MGYQKAEKFMDSLSLYGVRGASVKVSHKGKEVFCKMVGFMDENDSRPVTEDTRFRLYSLTKPVTTVAALTLYEQGKYLMTDPVEKYLPSFANQTVAKLKDNATYPWVNVPVSRPMQIRDLLTMTSGLTYGGLYHPAEKATSDGNDRLMKETEEKFTTRQFADMLGGLPLLFEPGSHWNYSYSMDVVGALIEVWSGMSFGEYVKETIFKPLGMEHTCFAPACTEEEKLCVYWDYNPEQKTYKKFEGNGFPLYWGKTMESGGAGLISTLGDYDKFARMLCNRGTAENGVKILGRKTVELMQKNHLNEQQQKDLDWGQLVGYGYGLGVRTMTDPVTGGSTSNIGEFGWSGLTGTYVLVDPEEELTIVYMQQMSPNMEHDIHPRLRNIIYGCIE